MVNRLNVFAYQRLTNWRFGWQREAMKVLLKPGNFCGECFAAELEGAKERTTDW